MNRCQLLRPLKFFVRQVKASYKLSDELKKAAKKKPGVKKPAVKKATTKKVTSST